MAAIVILPGLDGTGQLLGAFVRQLGPDLDTRLVAYPSDRELDYEQLATLVVDSLPRDKPFVLVAESFSGPVASRVAAQHPSGLAGVVFCASFVSSPIPALRHVSALLRFAPVRALPVAALAAVLLGRWSSKSHVARLERALGAVRPSVLRARARAALSAVLPPVGSIQVPVLYLQAESDRLVSRACFERLRRVAPSATVATIPGPHFLLQAAPQACANAVRSFVGGLRVSEV
jgi:pimeloyl-[acyl-carrier protein] methyl ester esterase